VAFSLRLTSPRTAQARMTVKEAALTLSVCDLLGKISHALAWKDRVTDEMRMHAAPRPQRRRTLAMKERKRRDA
jgi:hypothetical protein